MASRGSRGARTRGRAHGRGATNVAQSVRPVTRSQSSSGVSTSRGTRHLVATQQHVGAPTNVGSVRKEPVYKQTTKRSTGGPAQRVSIQDASQDNENHGQSFVEQSTTHAHKRSSSESQQSNNKRTRCASPEPSISDSISEQNPGHESPGRFDVLPLQATAKDEVRFPTTPFV